ncbi:hypothetical protein CCAX7_37710 [Capsulimonas corticalis]|uniref:Uncharacterized protein n=1 Tax=Capsulimonas corticalis TaxID=2219043 RepID=A0A402D105_9BACT|nr:hypothetical protein [Capsulimonas corticalis]BDI31720.1 hypothetical protein CCAX7_37710 [Capsulimonas corticalis]
MPLVEPVAPLADGLQSTMERTQTAAEVSVRVAAISDARMPNIVTQSVQDLNSAVARTKQAILSGSLSGDLSVAAAIGNLVVAASHIDHLIATIPPNLGVQYDVNG